MKAVIYEQVLKMNKHAAVNLMYAAMVEMSMSNSQSEDEAVLKAMGVDINADKVKLPSVKALNKEWADNYPVGE